MGNIRFMSLADTKLLLSSLDEETQEAVIEASDDIVRQVMATSEYSMPEGKTQMVERVLETTKLGTRGRAALQLLFEKSGFSVYMEHEKRDIKKPLLDSEVEY